MNKESIFNELRKITGKLTTAQVKAGNLIMDTMGTNIMIQLIGKPIMILTNSQLQAIYPGANAGFIDEINKLSAKYDITTKERLAMFLAQTLHETNGYTKLRESLNYSATRLKEVFPSRFKTLAAAQAVVAKGQSAIGDSIYGGRLGNGQNNGDGYKYRGGGFMHTTGKSNYQTAFNALKAMGTNVDIVSNPDLIITPAIAVETALIFWRDNKLNTFADAKNVTQATKIINGGTNGLAERTKLYNKAMSVL